MMLIAIPMCILNVHLHFQETREAHKEEERFESNWAVLRLTLWSYWGSILIAIYAIVFGIFVFGLTGFHTLIISENLTTYEKLKK